MKMSKTASSVVDVENARFSCKHSV